MNPIQFTDDQLRMMRDRQAQRKPTDTTGSDLTAGAAGAVLSELLELRKKENGNVT